jgi:hypothetical protein
MDSFIAVTATTTTTIEAPADQETSGNSGNAYCVVSRIEGIPTDQETQGGSGNAYCVVA